MVSNHKSEVITVILHWRSIRPVATKLMEFLSDNRIYSKVELEKTC